MDDKITANDSQPDLMNNLIPKEESKPNLQPQNIKKINSSKEKDLSNEVLYFSINQDSKLVIIIFIFKYI